MGMSTYVFTTYCIAQSRQTFLTMALKFMSINSVVITVCHYRSSRFYRTSDFDANVYVDILKFLTMAFKSVSINSVVITVCHYMSSRLSIYTETSHLPRDRTRWHTKTCRCPLWASIDIWSLCHHNLCQHVCYDDIQEGVLSNMSTKHIALSWYLKSLSS